MTDLQAKYITISRYIPAMIAKVELWQQEANNVQIYIHNFKGHPVDLELLHLRFLHAFHQIKDLTAFND